MTGGNFGLSSFTMNNIETFDEVYHPWEELVSEMMRLVTVYDKLVSVDVIGTTAEGRPIHAIHINTHMDKVCWFTRGVNHFNIYRTRFLIFQRDFWIRRTRFLIWLIGISRDFQGVIYPSGLPLFYSYKFSHTLVAPNV